MRYLLLLLLVGCAQSPVKFHGEENRIVWHKVPVKEVDLVCRTPHVQYSKTLRVYGCYRMEQGVCHVYAPDEQKYLHVLGHEVKHCFDGHFH